MLSSERVQRGFNRVNLHRHTSAVEAGADGPNSRCDIVNTRKAEPYTASQFQLKISVGLTSQVYLLEIVGIFTQGSQPGQTVGESGRWDFRNGQF